MTSTRDASFVAFPVTAFENLPGFNHPPRPMQETAKKIRTIRSFVRRAGRITQSQQRALDELWPVYGASYAGEALEFDRLFGANQPVVVEIGFGNGETLVEQAAANPDRNFLGIEVHEPGVGHCMLKAKEAGIENLRIIAHDAIDVLTYQVPANSLARLNLYFPDPWPKKRHHKRRIVQPTFIDLVADRLVDGGTLNIATDWANYAEHIDEILSQSDRFTCVERREHDGDKPLDRPQTKFERRGLRKGHRICDWCLSKGN
jgi:tRNA (guanine-N7-)-methyltransferase